MSKLLIRLDYNILYGKGVENRVADALSRRGWNQGDQAESFGIVTVVVPKWLKEVSESYENDEEVQDIIQALVVNA